MVWTRLLRTSISLHCIKCCTTKHEDGEMCEGWWKSGRVATAWETRAAAAAGAESVRSSPQRCRVSGEVKHNVALWDQCLWGCDFTQETKLSKCSNSVRSQSSPSPCPDIHWEDIFLLNRKNIFSFNMEDNSPGWVIEVSTEKGANQVCYFKIKCCRKVQEIFNFLDESYCFEAHVTSLTLRNCAELWTLYNINQRTSLII